MILMMKFRNITKTEGVILTISIGYMEFEAQFYGLGRKNRNAGNIGFIFDEVVKSTIKIGSSQ